MKSLYLVLFGQYTKHDQHTRVCFPPQHKAFASNVWKIFFGKGTIDEYHLNYLVLNVFERKNTNNSN